MLSQEPTPVPPRRGLSRHRWRGLWVVLHPQRALVPLGCGEALRGTCEGEGGFAAYTLFVSSFSANWTSFEPSSERLERVREGRDGERPRRSCACPFPCTELQRPSRGKESPPDTSSAAKASAPLALFTFHVALLERMSKITAINHHDGRRFVRSFVR